MRGAVAGGRRAAQEAFNKDPRTGHDAFVPA